ncbi:MAG: hypothetical protein RI101_13000 [Nitrospira sp.]|jgi:hypothetical protein|nr:hypothetical protein [Nitrospira sp.]
MAQSKDLSFLEKLDADIAQSQANQAPVTAQVHQTPTPPTEAGFTAIIFVLVMAGFIGMVVFKVRRSQKAGPKTSVNPRAERAAQIAQLESAMSKASKIVSAYGAVLEQEGEPGIMFYPLSDLPYTKTEIRAAIELLLVMEKDEAMRASLEVCDISLNQFIPDEEYRVVRQQRKGLSQALQGLRDGERDARKVAEAVLAGGTVEGEAQLRHIEERVRQEDQRTLMRHKELRQKG